MKAYHALSLAVWCSIFATGPAASANPPIITVAPAIERAEKVPLACTLSLETDQITRLRVEVESDSHNWSRDFFNWTDQHEQRLFGFRAGSEYTITLTVFDEEGFGTVLPNLFFNTDPLPADMFPIVVDVSIPEKMEPGFTLFFSNFWARSTSEDYTPRPVIVDHEGEVVWYAAASGLGLTGGLELNERGHLFSPGGVEVDLFGNPVWDFVPEFIDPHHDLIFTPFNTIITLEEHELSALMPSSVDDPNAPYAEITVQYDDVVEYDPYTNQVINRWSLWEMLDQNRINQLSFRRGDLDWAHSNAVYYDPWQDSVYVSVRHQDAIISIDRESGALEWILGTPSNWGAAFHPFLLTPTDVIPQVEWHYAQHAVELTRDGSLIIYDNGNFRASAFEPILDSSENASAAIKYRVDTHSNTVERVWRYVSDTPLRYYARAQGDADELPLTENVLITHSTNDVLDNQITPVHTRIIEVTQTDPAEIVFSMRISPDLFNETVQFSTYRSERIFDFYGKGDIDLNGRIDLDDYMTIASALGRVVRVDYDPRDLNRNGSIDAGDLVEMHYAFGSSAWAKYPRVRASDFIQTPLGLIDDSHWPFVFAAEQGWMIGLEQLPTGFFVWSLRHGFCWVPFDAPDHMYTLEGPGWVQR